MVFSLIDTLFFEIDTVSSENKIVKCEAGKFEADTVVMATGVWKGSSSSKFKGEEEFLGRGVSYCATCDGAFYRGMKVAVVGNGEEACEEALYLTQFASEVLFFSSWLRKARCCSKVYAFCIWFCVLTLLQCSI